MGSGCLLIYPNVSFCHISRQRCIAGSTGFLLGPVPCSVQVGITVHWLGQSRGDLRFGFLLELEPTAVMPPTAAAHSTHTIISVRLAKRVIEMLPQSSCERDMISTSQHSAS